MIAVASGVFFASGVAALLYQVIWQRLLVMFSGADVFSVTLIVAAFMGGLGIGNLVGGHVADRVSRARALLLFAVAEVAVGLFGLFSGPFLYDVVYRRLASLHLPSGAIFVILFVILLWPTFFMGASLPLLTRTLTSAIDRAAGVVGMLYGVNTCGAAAGALLSTWWLLPTRGLDGSLELGATLNFLCAGVVVAMSMLIPRGPDGRPIPTATVRELGSTDRSPYPIWFWAVLFGFSGLLALSLEIVWFRLLDVMMKSIAFTFGTLLVLYLGPLGLGSVAGSFIARRTLRPAVVFLALQAAVTLAAAVSFLEVMHIVDGAPWFHQYFENLAPLNIPEAVSRLRGAFFQSASDGPAGDATLSTFVRLFVALPAMLVVVPTFLMGCSFPILHRIIQTDLARVGRRVGHLLLANIVGSLVGSVVTGWVLLEYAGTSGTLKMVAAGGAVFAVLAVERWWRARPVASPGRRHTPAAIGATAVALVASPVLLIPDNDALWSRLHGTATNRSVIVEDRSGLSVIRTESAQAVVFVNGLSQSALPYGGLHTALGAIPALLHPEPKSAAIIGLGSGDTVYAVAGRKEIERIDCIEIIDGQLRALKALNAIRRFGGLRGLLDDPRVSHTSGDGRIHLVRSRVRYDIIEADALQPHTSHSGNLYSEEFFRLVRDRLSPGGLAVTWVPTERVQNSFLRAFPHAIGMPGILLGSSEPIRIDRTAVARRAADPDVRAHFAADGVDIVQLMETHLAGPIASYGPEFPRGGLIDFNSDRFPRDEFDLSRGKR
jgi:spermidine synthase